MVYVPTVEGQFFFFVFDIYIESLIFTNSQDYNFDEGRTSSIINIYFKVYQSIRVNNSIL